MLLTVSSYQKFDSEIEKIFDKLKPTISKESLQKNIESNNIYPYQIKLDDFICGYVFIRIDTTYHGEKVCVIMFTASVSKKVILTNYLGMIYDQIANGMTIRVHSTRRGVDKLLESDGYEFLETVFIKKGRKNVN